MNDPAFFGYGSLVNLNTHSYVNPQRRQITGWRRVWRSLHNTQVATLSVTRDPQTTLDGITAHVPDADWRALDARETGYDRQTLPDGTAIYEVTQGFLPEGATRFPILRSYLDVVIQGYLTQFGPEGAIRFFATTSNWGPIQDDRNAPLYPRHQALTTDETAFIDSHLAGMLGCCNAPTNS